MLSTTHTRRRPARSTGIKGFFAGLLAMDAVWRQRRKLSALDQHALDDMGLTQSDVDAELRRTIWDAPRNWRK